MTELIPGDYRAQAKKLRVTRGKGYYTILKAILYEVGPQIAADANAIKAESGGKFTVYNIGCLAVKYDLNFKATCEWLEESRVLPVGTYDRLKRGGIKFGETLEAIRRRDEQRPDYSRKINRA